jgi:hypothetical protein
MGKDCLAFNEKKPEISAQLGSPVASCPRREIVARRKEKRSDDFSVWDIV